MEERDIKSKVQATNKMLLEGEPNNISVDDHSGYTGYKPQYVADAMNCCFGFGGWGFEEISSEMITTQGEKGPSMLIVSQVKVWLSGIEFQPAAWGQARVTRGDIGDAKKGAQTDAIKKALSYLSIGARAYKGQLKAH